MKTTLALTGIFGYTEGQKPPDCGSGALGRIT